MKQTAFIISLIIAFLSMSVLDVDSARPRPKKRSRTHRVVKKRRTVHIPTIHENPFMQCEDTCSHTHGIDLSHYQGEVFWELVGDGKGTSYVYLKATEGGDRIDAQYERNISMAHRHGLKVGSYHFFRPKTDLTQQLANFKTQCLPCEQDLIPMLDIESTGGLPLHAFRDSLSKFLTLMEEAYHQKPLIYTGRNFYNKYLQGHLDNYLLMVALYTDEPPVLADNRDVCMWQYTSRGRIHGIRGFVDKSRFMGDHDLDELRFIR